MRKHLLYIFTGFLLGVLVYSYVRFSHLQKFYELLLSGILGILIAYGAHWSNVLLDRLIPWRKQPGLRLLIGIISLALVGCTMVFSALWVYHMSVENLQLFSEDPEDMALKIIILLLCISLLYNIIYFALYSYDHYAQGQVLELQLERKQTQLQLAALKSQLSPHFLFNSMNTLSSLFAKDVDKAETFIRALAQSYQYTLNKYEDLMVPVAEELKFVQAYCFLMRTRFGEHLSLEIDLDKDTMNSKVPPLTLQMLVENAVKHNVMNSSQPLKVRLSSDGSLLSVSNNKTSKRPKMESLKIGLKNIAARYDLLVNKKIEIEDSERFTVRLPLIP
ncbi:MAG: histidine kinase [Bacteroidota bacterium]